MGFSDLFKNRLAVMVVIPLAITAVTVLTDQLLKLAFAKSDDDDTPKRGPSKRAAFSMTASADDKPDGTLSTIMNVATAKRAKTTRSPSISIRPTANPVDRRILRITEADEEIVDFVPSAGLESTVELAEMIAALLGGTTSKSGTRALRLMRKLFLELCDNSRTGDSAVENSSTCRRLVAEESPVVHKAIMAKGPPKPAPSSSSPSPIHFPISDTSTPTFGSSFNSFNFYGPPVMPSVTERQAIVPNIVEAKAVDSTASAPPASTPFTFASPTALVAEPSLHTTMAQASGCHEPASRSDAMEMDEPSPFRNQAPPVEPFPFGSFAVVEPVPRVPDQNTEPIYFAPHSAVAPPPFFAGAAAMPLRNQAPPAKPFPFGLFSGVEPSPTIPDPTPEPSYITHHSSVTPPPFIVGAASTGPATKASRATRESGGAQHPPRAHKSDHRFDPYIGKLLKLARI